MTEITVRLRKTLGAAVCLRADLADCPDALEALSLLLPALRLVRFLGRGVDDQGRKRPGNRCPRGHGDRAVS